MNLLNLRLFIGNNVFDLIQFVLNYQGQSLHVVFIESKYRELDQHLVHQKWFGLKINGLLQIGVAIMSHEKFAQNFVVFDLWIVKNGGRLGVKMQLVVVRSIQAWTFMHLAVVYGLSQFRLRSIRLRDIKVDLLLCSATNRLEDWIEIWVVLGFLKVAVFHLRGF